ncbi:MAG: hypothetical protein WA941_06670 [Nitrososphaeraceae archaeon]
MTTDDGIALHENSIGPVLKIRLFPAQCLDPVGMDVEYTELLSITFNQYIKTYVS